MAPEPTKPAYPLVIFHLVCGVDPLDKRSNCPLVFSIKKDGPDQTIFVFPVDQQPLRNHTLLAGLQSISSAVGLIKQRKKYRNIAVKLTKELYETYYDEVGNAWFRNELLEDITSYNNMYCEEEENIPAAPPQPQQQKSLQTITKDAVITHFDGEKPNANSWILEYERECNRLALSETNRCLAFRLFLDDLAKEWHQTTYKQIGVATWVEWRTKFLEYYGTKGLDDNVYAINYKYLGGSLNQYVTHKLALLSDVDVPMCEALKVLLVIAGLPENIRTKLEKEKAKTISDIMPKIHQLDKNNKNNSNNNISNGKNSTKKTENKNYPNTNNNSNNNAGTSQNRNNNTAPYRNPNHKPCSFCEKVNRPGRFHAEADCRTKLRPDYSFLVSKHATNKNVRMVNNTEMEELLNKEQETKN